MTDETRADLEFLKSQKEEEIDLSADEDRDRSGEGGWVRGEFYRPLKKPISIRIDLDVLEWFKDQEIPYQRLINRALRDYMERHGNRQTSKVS